MGISSIYGTAGKLYSPVGMGTNMLKANDFEVCLMIKAVLEGHKSGWIRETFLGAKYVGVG